MATNGNEIPKSCFTDELKALLAGKIPEEAWNEVVKRAWPNAPPGARTPDVPCDVWRRRLELLEAYMTKAYEVGGNSAARASGTDFIAMVIVADTDSEPTDGFVGTGFKSTDYFTLQ